MDSIHKKIKGYSESTGVNGAIFLQDLKAEMWSYAYKSTYKKTPFKSLESVIVSNLKEVSYAKYDILYLIKYSKNSNVVQYYYN